MLPDDFWESKVKTTEPIKKDLPLQQIYYGAPSTGKSHTINEITSRQPKENVFRTSFHPDSDYSTFVGCYKPTMKENIISKNGIESKEGQIIYAFTPQAFTRAYVRTWKNMGQPVFLIIEEINRGNCAKIFGDLFQLLDRGDDGYSCYPIDADKDLRQHLESKLDEESKGIKNGKLSLPPNLHIWATMNTSDQSLFPIDSAFKRRWLWKYVPITNANEGYKIAVGEKRYDWWEFIEKVNEKIYNINKSEDKKLGYFFAKATDKIIDTEQFVSKVVFYLWNDVFKDAFGGDSIFSEGLQFHNFFDSKGEPLPQKVEEFMNRLGIEPDGEASEATEGSE